MSLINDALKKAQRQRHGEPTPLSSPPSAPATPPPPPSSLTSPRGKPAARPTQFLLVGAAGAALALLLAVGGYFLFVAKPEAPRARPSVPAIAQTATPAPAQPAAARPPEPGPTTPTPIPAVSLPAAHPAPAVSTPPPTAVAQPSTAAPVQPPATPAAATTTPDAHAAAPATAAAASATPPAPAAAETPAGRPKPSARMISVIHNLEITGIRAAGTDSRVLMNNKVFKVGDVIDAEIGLRLTGVAKGALTFEDNRGATYTRTL